MGAAKLSGRVRTLIQQQGSRRTSSGGLRVASLGDSFLRVGKARLLFAISALLILLACVAAPVTIWWRLAADWTLYTEPHLTFHADGGTEDGGTGSAGGGGASSGPSSDPVPGCGGRNGWQEDSVTVAACSGNWSVYDANAWHCPYNVSLGPGSRIRSYAVYSPVVTTAATKAAKAAKATKDHIGDGQVDTVGLKCYDYRWLPGSVHQGGVSFASSVVALLIFSFGSNVLILLMAFSYSKYKESQFGHFLVCRVVADAMAMAMVIVFHVLDKRLAAGLPCHGSLAGLAMHFLVVIAELYQIIIYVDVRMQIEYGDYLRGLGVALFEFDARRRWRCSSLANCLSRTRVHGSVAAVAVLATSVFAILHLDGMSTTWVCWVAYDPCRETGWDYRFHLVFTAWNFAGTVWAVWSSRSLQQRLRASRKTDDDGRRKAKALVFWAAELADPKRALKYVRSYLFGMIAYAAFGAAIFITQIIQRKEDVTDMEDASGGAVSAVVYLTSGSSFPLYYFSLICLRSMHTLYHEVTLREVIMLLLAMLLRIRWLLCCGCLRPKRDGGGLHGHQSGRQHSTWVENSLRASLLAADLAGDAGDAGGASHAGPGRGAGSARHGRRDQMGGLLHKLDHRHLVCEVKFSYGGQGQVFKGRYKSDVVCVKELYTFCSAEDGENIEQHVLNGFQREVQLLGLCNHPNIVHLFGYAHDEARGGLLIVTELVRGGTLVDVLEDSRVYSGGGMPKCLQFYILRQIASAMSHVHDQQILHRDRTLTPGFSGSEGVRV